MVLDELWRTLRGVEQLSGPHGGPLSRTVKLVLDPLVVRPVHNPACAAPLLTPEGAAQLAELLSGAADRLRDTASWFGLLKQARRAAKITEGNPQDLYFQRCFELAAVHGAPGARAEVLAAATIADIHSAAAGRTVAALREYLTDPVRARNLLVEIAEAWQRRPALATAPAAVELRALLDACVPGADNAAANTDPIGSLAARHAGARSGISLWHNLRAQRLGLTEHPQPVRPEVGQTASTATLAPPFDRSIYERVFTILQSSTDRAELPAVPELVAAEAERSCAPWALLDESLRITAAAGAELATGLRPTGGDGPTAAHQRINRRWQREAYVLRARRLTVGEFGVPTGKLAEVAAELHQPWRTYLRRLWVRLHGRDVRGFGVSDTDEMWDLFDGVARSVILDHRDRVKQALALAGADGTPATSRAS